MDNNAILVFMDIFPIIFLAVYGYRFKYKTPDFGEQSGFNTPYTKASKQAWDYGHKIAGSICLWGAIVACVLTIGKYIFYTQFPQYANNTILDWTIIGGQFLLVLLIMPITNASIKKKFGTVEEIEKKARKKKKKED